MSNSASSGLVSPAAERNKGPILEILRRVLPQTGSVLEIASGTGQHVAHFSAHLPHLVWQPSDPDDESRASISRWIGRRTLANVLPPLDLNVTTPTWPVAQTNAIICINMIHISPWEATLSLLAGGRRLLAPGEVLFLYGPYCRDGGHTSASNAEFDANLRARNAAWGIRDLEVVTECAQCAGFAFEEAVAMPANNFSVIFRRTGSEASRSDS